MESAQKPERLQNSHPPLLSGNPQRVLSSQEWLKVKLKVPTLKVSLHEATGQEPAVILK